MLEMLVDLSGNLANLTKTPDGMKFGRSCITRFKTVHLVSESWNDEKSAHIWIGEERDPFPRDAKYDVIPDYPRYFAREGLKILLDHEGSGISLRLIRTGAGSTPIYICLNNTDFICSWDFDWVAKRISSPRLNPEACQLYIDEGPALVREQIIEGMYLLWPGESAIISVGDCRFVEQPEVSIVAPSYIRDDAMVCDAFLEIVSGVLRPRIEKSSGVMLEVSGGLDSSCAALAAGMVSDTLNCYGLIHEGAMGEQQSRRRQELVRLLSLNDFEYPSYRYPPIAALSLPDSSITPNDDNHRVSCGMGIDGHPAGNIDLLIAGIGGDELFMRGSYKREKSYASAERRLAGGVMDRS